MFKVTQNVIRYSKPGSGVHSFLRLNNFASAPITAAVRNIENDVSPETMGQAKKSSIQTGPVISSNISDKSHKPPKVSSALVAAAFASLRNDKSASDIKTPFTDSRITNATTVGELLSISDGNGVSRRHALKVVSVLADWSTSGKTQLSEFESDPRFIRLCKILTKGNNISKKSLTSLRNEDLSTILNVTADDEAAKLITSISLPQMVKVMSTLSLKKRRSTPLLRSLAFNITRNLEHLDLKQAADVLYSSAVLNFIDENLLEKVCADVCISLQENVKGSAAIGSVLTSLGVLRYKNTGLLDSLSEWVLQNHEMCRPQDVFSLFITLAILNYQPTCAEQLYQTLVPQLKIAEAMKPLVWLDVVWSLVVLNKAESDHISTVLSAEFIKKVEEDLKLGIASKLKLLNIDSACKLLIKDYEGPRLPPDSPVKQVIGSRSKDKEFMVTSVHDSLSNLLNSKTHMKINIDTGMGFYVDAELALDNKCNPISLNQQGNGSDYIKIAVVVYDYHDICRGRLEPTGINTLFRHLLEAQGYKILTVPYTEFNPKDKLVTRVQYLEGKLKNFITSS